VSWKKWGVILILLSLLWLWQQWPDGKLHVAFCDVGQGDGALVALGAFQALIDTGPSEEKLWQCLTKEMPFWDRKIDLVFISHQQSDHSGALADLLKRYQVSKLIQNAEQNDVYRYGDLYFDILSEVQKDKIGETSTSKEENELAMVIRLEYREFSALFTADIGEKTESALLADGVLKKVTLLKVPHHGSKYSSTLSFLEALSPRVAVISVGAKNSYGHPHGDTLMRLDSIGAEVLRTDQVGTVEIVTDGYRFDIYNER